MNQEDVVVSAPEGLTLNTLKISNEGRLFHVSKEAKVLVYDLSGSLVQQYEKTTQFNLSSLKSGVYIIKATTTGGNVATKKAVF